MRAALRRGSCRYPRRTRCIPVRGLRCQIGRRRSMCTYVRPVDAR